MAATTAHFHSPFVAPSSSSWIDTSASRTAFSNSFLNLAEYDPAYNQGFFTNSGVFSEPPPPLFDDFSAQYQLSLPPFYPETDLQYLAQRGHAQQQFLISPQTLYNCPPQMVQQPLQQQHTRTPAQPSSGFHPTQRPQIPSTGGPGGEQQSEHPIQGNVTPTGRNPSPAPLIPQNIDFDFDDTNPLGSNGNNIINRALLTTSSKSVLSFKVYFKDITCNHCPQVRTPQFDIQFVLSRSPLIMTERTHICLRDSRDSRSKDFHATPLHLAFKSFDSVPPLRDGPTQPHIQGRRRACTVSIANSPATTVWLPVEHQHIPWGRKPLAKPRELSRLLELHVMLFHPNENSPPRCRTCNNELTISRVVITQPSSLDTSEEL